MAARDRQRRASRDAGRRSDCQSTLTPTPLPARAQRPLRPAVEHRRHNGFPPPPLPVFILRFFFFLSLVFAPSQTFFLTHQSRRRRHAHRPARSLCHTHTRTHKRTQTHTLFVGRYVIAGGRRYPRKYKFRLYVICYVERVLATYFCIRCKRFV